MIHPFVFKNKCPKCLSTDLLYLDMQETEHKNMLFTTRSVKCNKCNTEFFIKWDKCENDSDITPYISYKDIDGFVDEIRDYSIKHRRNIL